MLRNGGVGTDSWRLSNVPGRLTVVFRSQLTGRIGNMASVRDESTLDVDDRKPRRPLGDVWGTPAIALATLQAGAGVLRSGVIRFVRRVVNSAAE